ncbi:DUF4326 domain-containing protein [Azospirillum sp. Sh1]|uniref:DUF4326 domain-containing protein n=1 Tax=Azospirillum sp. Sh1 TaxID=2607285 RepID=UPI0011EC5D03|nr:DUF4326 domain-containing protein [Azospirillum sp. Sh1]KAA0571115.1 DUF4326 domain-containing protein [Azospirillum sp. Sh1]
MQPDRTTPRRIQRSRAKGWRMPANAIYVGRGTPYGNPWRVGQRGEPEPRTGPTDDKRYDLGGGGYLRAFNPPIKIHLFPAPLTAEDVVSRYRAHIVETVGVERIRHDLAGRDLACWCKPGAPCHADVLLEIANGPDAAF